jgi:hypothetical protein
MTQRRLIDTLREFRMGNADPKAWVKNLEERKNRGERLTPAQLEMLRAAKRHEGWTGGGS